MRPVPGPVTQDTGTPRGADPSSRRQRQSRCSLQRSCFVQEALQQPTERVKGSGGGLVGHRRPGGGGGGATISLVHGKLAAFAARDEPSRLRIQSVMRKTPPASTPSPSPSPYPSPSPSPSPPPLFFLSLNPRVSPPLFILLIHHHLTQLHNVIVVDTPFLFHLHLPTHALQLPFKHLHRLLRLPYPPVPLQNPLARVPPPGDVPTPPALRQFCRPFFHPAAEAFNIAPRLLQPPEPRRAPEPPARYSLSSQSRARATGGDALGEARLARPLVAQAVAPPMAGERGLPTGDVWERPEEGGGAGEASAELLRGSERVAPCAPSGAGGGGAASAAPRASVSVIPSCRQGCRREANPTQTPCSGDVPTTCSGDVLATFQWPLERRQNIAGTGCWIVAGTVENRHSSARAQGALRALRPRGGGDIHYKES